MVLSVFFMGNLLSLNNTTKLDGSSLLFVEAIIFSFKKRGKMKGEKQRAVQALELHEMLIRL